MDKDEAAANHLTYCLRHYPTAQSLKQKRLVQESFNQAKEKVGSVFVETDVEEARVAITGRDIGKTPMSYEYFLLPGEYRVRAEKGRLRSESAFRVEAGRRTNVDLMLASVSESIELYPKSAPAKKSKIEAPPDDTNARPTWVPAYLLGGASIAPFGISMCRFSRAMDPRFS